LSADSGTTHVVKQGEHLSQIAKNAGFRDFHTIWDHPANAQLRATRDPHVLFPGDKVFIPEHKTKAQDRGTDALHDFVVTLTRLFLRLRVLDLDGNPITGAACDIALQSGKDADEASTDGKGIVEDEIPDPAIHQGEVTVHVPPPKPPPPDPVPEKKLKLDVHIGKLNPEFKLSGQQARLNNLGYFAGYTLKDLDELLWAAEEFECDHITKPVPKRPEIVPAPAGGEDDENTTDPQQHTGIKDATIFNALKKAHGI